jgi:hypothetical protein
VEKDDGDEATSDRDGGEGERRGARTGGQTGGRPSKLLAPRLEQGRLEWANRLLERPNRGAARGSFQRLRRRLSRTAPARAAAWRDSSTAAAARAPNRQPFQRATAAMLRCHTAPARPKPAAVGAPASTRPRASPVDRGRPCALAGLAAPLPVARWLRPACGLDAGRASAELPEGPVEALDAGTHPASQGRRRAAAGGEEEKSISVVRPAISPSPPARQAWPAGWLTRPAAGLRSAAARARSWIRRARRSGWDGGGSWFCRPTIRLASQRPERSITSIHPSAGRIGKPASRSYRVHRHARRRRQHRSHAH